MVDPRSRPPLPRSCHHRDITAAPARPCASRDAAASAWRPGECPPADQPLGATGPEPATSGVTGRYELNRHGWPPPRIPAGAGNSCLRELAVTGYERLPPGRACVVLVQSDWWRNRQQSYAQCAAGSEFRNAGVVHPRDRFTDVSGGERRGDVRRQHARPGERRHEVPRRHPVGSSYPDPAVSGCSVVLAAISSGLAGRSWADARRRRFALVSEFGVGCERGLHPRARDRSRLRGEEDAQAGARARPRMRCSVSRKSLRSG